MNAEDSVHSTASANLARMLDWAGAQSQLWTDRDLNDILQHQLAASVYHELAAADPRYQEQVSPLSTARGPVMESFSDLLFHPHPPVELLRLTKDYAKLQRDSPDSQLPAEIATVLYFASILAALLRCNERITTLSDSQLLQSIDWALAQSWMEDRTRSLLLEGKSRLEQQ